LAIVAIARPGRDVSRQSGAIPATKLWHYGLDFAPAARVLVANGSGLASVENLIRT
jgi:hypothetical protein